MENKLSKKKRLSKYFGAFLIVILILIPLFYLRNYFVNQEKEYQEINLELAKERLLSEMDKFQNDLKPETYIEKAFLALEKEFGLPDLQSQNFKFSFDSHDKPNYVPKDFLDKAREFLSVQFGINPFLFISANQDLEDLNYFMEKNIFPNEEEKRNFILSIIGLVAYCNYKEPYGLLPIYKENTKQIKEITSIILSLKNSNRLHSYNMSLKEFFSIQFARNISLFYCDASQPQTCCPFFINKSGNQRGYQIYNTFIVPQKSSYFYNLGFYYTCIKASDISVEKLLNFATASSENNLISRRILEHPIDSPKIINNDEYISYNCPFSSLFHALISDHQNCGEEIYNKLQDYLYSHSLEVIINKKNIETPYHLAVKIINTTITAFIIIVLLAIIRILCNKKFNLNLTNKVKFAVFIAVIIPVSGIGILSYQTIINQEKLFINQYRKIINERFALFCKLNEDYSNIATYEIQQYKKELADFYFSMDYNSFIKACRQGHYKPIEGNSYYNLGRTILINKNGQYVTFNTSGFREHKYEFSTIATPYNLLSNLNILDNSTSDNKKLQEKKILFSSLTEAYFKNYNKRNVLALESHQIPSESFVLRDRNIYQLLAPYNAPLKPEAILYHNLDISKLTQRLIYNIKYHYPKLLCQDTPLCQIQYGLFERSEKEIIEQIPQNNSAPFRSMLLENAKNALRKRNSGFEITENQDFYYINAWQFFNDNRLVLTAAAIAPKRNNLLITGNIIAIILAIYAFFAVALLSELLTGALLSPIKSLSNFVNKIKDGNLNVKTIINSGDELQELGDSFNTMSEGLCEREKLKRFVSDKLYSSLEQNQNQQNQKARVTVLSSDIRSFTTISQVNEPEAVVNLLNDYFTLMEQAITQYGGSIEKIIGDAIFAAFYEEQNAEFSLNACKAALEMRKSLKKFNEEREEKGLFTIENGVGLATGDIIIGFAGQQARRKEFLLIGDVLKNAENLESMTKQAESSKVFIDKATFENIKGKIQVCESKPQQEIFYRELKL